MARSLAESILVRVNPSGWGPSSDYSPSLPQLKPLSEGQSRFIDFAASKPNEEDDEYTTVEGKIQSKSKYLVRRGLIPLKAIRGRVNLTYANRPTMQQKTVVKKIYREPSVQIRGEWTMITELGKQHFDKLAQDPGEPVDIQFLTKVRTYNSTLESLQVKKPLPLKTSSLPTTYSNTTSTSEDPVMKEFINSETSGVFITDIILTTIMTTLRSIYPWDILITKEDDKIVFDKQQNSTLEMMTVNENAAEGLPEEEEREDSINGVRELAKEALRIHRAFRQIVTKTDLFPENVETHPDDLVAESEHSCSHVGYRYRKWTLPGSGPTPPVPVFVRTEVDTYVRGPEEYALVRAVNEYDARITGSYRMKLENNRGQVLSTEAKNNACKLSKWTLQARLSGASSVKVGFVSREDSKSNSKHVLLGVVPYLTNSLNSQLNLNYNNWCLLHSWGIFRYIIELCRAQPNGRYYLLKDPNKQMVRLYRIPQDAQQSELAQF